MLLQFKIHLIGITYMFGILFVFFFPPRNYSLSGSKIRTKRSSDDEALPNQYIDYDKLISKVQAIVKTEKEVVRVEYLTPKTTQNRSIVALELKSDEQSKKPGILIIGALNGMAWGAPFTIMELAERLLYNSNYQTPFFNDYDWYLIPMPNPDGMEFTLSVRDRPPEDSEVWSRNMSIRNTKRPMTWHKNCDPENENPCFGTNINRNFAYHWQDDVHKMPDICSQHYPGAKPFTTAEARALRTYLHKIGDVVDLAIHLHASFVPKKEYILFPWRYAVRVPSNVRSLQFIGEYAARQSKLPDGRLYEVRQSSSQGRVAGTLCDYITGVVGTDLVYLIKPYYPPFSNLSDEKILKKYVKKSISAILSLVRGWRSSTNQNTLYFFGKEVEF